MNQSPSSVAVVLAKKMAPIAFAIMRGKTAIAQLRRNDCRSRTWIL